MSFSKINELRQRKAQLLAEGRSILERAEKDNQRANTPEENSQWDAINKDISTLDSRIQNYERLFQMEKDAAEGKSGNAHRFANDLGANSDPKEKNERHKRAFDGWLRDGSVDPVLLEGLSERSALAKGSLVVGPQDFYPQLVQIMKYYAGPLNNGAELITTTTGNDLPILTSDDTSNSGQLLAEATQETNQVAPTIANVTLKAYKFSSKEVLMSMELLQDNGVDVQSKISSIIGERIGRTLNTYMTTGTGTAQPQGIVTASSEGVGAADFDGDAVIDLIHSVDPAYRSDPSFRLMMHDTTLAAIRKLKDSQNRYIFEPGLNGPVSDRICGVQYFINNDMDQFGDGVNSTGVGTSKLIVAGPMNRYKIRFVQGVEVMQLRELFAQYFQVAYLGFLRADARAADSTCFKYLLA